MKGAGLDAGGSHPQPGFWLKLRFALWRAWRGIRRLFVCGES